MAEFKLPHSGLKCGDCNAELPRVFKTIRTSGFIMRQRICPRCGKVNETSERVISTRDRYFRRDNHN